MMMKKVAGLAAAGAMLFATAGSVFASGITISNFGEATQTSIVSSRSNTGNNKFKVSGGSDVVFQGGSNITGNTTAIADSQSIANQFVNKVKTFGDVHTITVTNHGEAEQNSIVDAKANVGNNKFRVYGDEGRGSVTQSGSVLNGNTAAVSSSQSWANIFNSKVFSFDGSVE